MRRDDSRDSFKRVRMGLVDWSLWARVRRISIGRGRDREWPGRRSAEYRSISAPAWGVVLYSGAFVESGLMGGVGEGPRPVKKTDDTIQNRFDSEGTGRFIHVSSGEVTPIFSSRRALVRWLGLA